VKSTREKKNEKNRQYDDKITHMPYMAFGHHHYAQKHVCLLEFHPRHKRQSKEKHQYKFITKEDQETGIGENKKEYIFTSYECV